MCFLAKFLLLMTLDGFLSANYHTSCAVVVCSTLVLSIFLGHMEGNYEINIEYISVVGHSKDVKKSCEREKTVGDWWPAEGHFLIFQVSIVDFIRI